MPPDPKPPLVKTTGVPDPKPTIVRRIPTEPTCIIAVCGCRYRVFTKGRVVGRDEGALVLDAPCPTHATSEEVSCQQDDSPVPRFEQ